MKTIAAKNKSSAHKMTVLYCKPFNLIQLSHFYETISQSRRTMMSLSINYSLHYHEHRFGPSDIRDLPKTDTFALTITCLILNIRVHKANIWDLIIYYINKRHIISCIRMWYLCKFVSGEYIPIIHIDGWTIMELSMFEEQKHKC